MTDSRSASEPAGERLRQLAEAHGISTEYWDFHGNLASPSRDTKNMGEALENIFRSSKTRIIVATFSSNVHLPLIVYALSKLRCT